MLYVLFEWLEAAYQPPGFQAVQFITVRATLAAVTALLVALFAGKRIIRLLRRRQLGETVRTGEDAGVVSHAHKAGTPTMGGTIILLALFSAVLLWGDLTNVYVLLALFGTGWMGALGFADDYIKTIKKNKDGLSEKAKLIAQVTFGAVLGTTLYFHPDTAEFGSMTSLPLVANGVIDYDVLSPLLNSLGWGIDVGWAIYIVVVTFILTGVSNAVNLTDGLDGLAAGTSAFVAAGLVVLCYISGNALLADFLNEIFLPGSGELTIFAAAVTAACFGFLWYNSHPAQVFMGDTGSLALGAAIGAMAIMIRKELLLPILCGIFFLETLSVILQTSYFKWTKKRTGEGKRIFRMAPLHHHYEAMGIHESKIVIRFWIVTAILVIVTFLTLRLQ
ncbi:MAG: phospho-N-acetylmuramoyl-pentapeptide-transferase [Bacteroidota bacterium]